MADLPTRLRTKAAALRAAGKAGDDALLDEAAAEIERLRQSVVACAGAWAAEYARQIGLPKGHLHPRHYDILVEYGARMDDFTRAALYGDA